MHEKFKSLCAPKKPICAKQLFGEDLAKTVKDLDETSKVTQKLTVTNDRKNIYSSGNGKYNNYNNYKQGGRGNRGRGSGIFCPRGRGRGFLGYRSQSSGYSGNNRQNQSQNHKAKTNNSK